MQNDNINNVENSENEVVETASSSYLVEIQLLGTILAIGQQKQKRDASAEEARHQKESLSPLSKFNTAIDFIDEFNITSDYFADPELKKVFEVIYRKGIQSPSGDIPNIHELDSVSESLAEDINSTYYPSDIENLIERAEELKLYHKLNTVLSEGAKRTSENSNEGLIYLKAEVERLQESINRKAYDIIQNSKNRFKKREEVKKSKGKDYVKTGFPEFDKDIEGLSPGEELFVIFARTGIGKAQPLHSKVLTPQGYISMRNVRIGLPVITGTGEVGIVEEIFPQGEIDTYKVTFVTANGKERVVECSDEHLWKVKLNHSEKYYVMPLKDIMKKYINNEVTVDYVNSKTFKVYQDVFKIKNIEYNGKQECQCLMINHPDHTYVTNGGVVTHNTWVLLKFLQEAWKSMRNVALIEPEMTADKIDFRFDTLNEHFSNSSLMYGKEMEPNQEESYQEYIDNLPKSSTKFLVAHPKDFGDRITVSKIEAYCVQNKVNALGIDGLSYIDDERSRPGDNTTTMLTHISADLMNISVKLGIPIVVVVQSNRENGVAQGGKPQLDNIRDSDGIAYSASMVCSLYKKQNALHICLLKNRNGVSDRTYAYDWDINTGTFAFLGYGDVEDENFGGESEAGSNYNSFRPRNQQPSPPDYSSNPKAAPDEMNLTDNYKLEGEEAF